MLPSRNLEFGTLGKGSAQKATSHTGGIEMKKILLITGGTLLLLVMLLAMTTSMAAAAGGSGTPADPFLIHNQADLQAISGSLSAHYELADNIVYSGNFTPIGDYTTPFTGSFDGSSSAYTISNLTINLPSTYYVGLFGCVDGGAVIENVALMNVNITGNQVVGGLVGQSRGSIANCYVSGGVNGVQNVGGLVGTNDGSIGNSCTVVGVNGESQVGGLVGFNFSGTISNCYTTGGVDGEAAVGGLVGSNFSGTIINCYTTGGVHGTQLVGGLVGLTHGGSISNCYTVSGVHGESSVGGLIGGAMPGYVEVNSYWMGNQFTSVGGTKETDHRAFFSAAHPVYDQNGANPWDFTNTWGMADGSSYPYMGNPGMAAPVFEIWTIVFVAIGLIGIAGFIWYRRRKMVFA